MSHLHETCDICSLHVVDVAIRFCPIFYALSMNSVHDGVEFFIHFGCTPAEVHGVLRHFQSVVATPPAFTALPGAYIILLSMKRSIASGVHPILEISPTHVTLLSMRCCASSPFSSFWVAQGRAMSAFTSHGRLPATKVEPGNSSAYGATISLPDAVIPTYNQSLSPLTPFGS